MKEVTLANDRLIFYAGIQFDAFRNDEMLLRPEVRSRARKCLALVLNEEVQSGNAREVPRASGYLDYDVNVRFSSVGEHGGE